MFIDVDDDDDADENGKLIIPCTKFNVSGISYLVLSSLRESLHTYRSRMTVQITRTERNRQLIAIDRPHL